MRERVDRIAGNVGSEAVCGYPLSILHVCVF